MWSMCTAPCHLKLNSNAYDDIYSKFNVTDGIYRVKLLLQMIDNKQYSFIMPIVAKYLDIDIDWNSKFKFFWMKRDFAWFKTTKALDKTYQNTTDLSATVAALCEAMTLSSRKSYIS